VNFLTLWIDKCYSVTSVTSSESALSTVVLASTSADRYGLILGLPGSVEIRFALSFIAALTARGYTAVKSQNTRNFPGREVSGKSA